MKRAKKGKTKPPCALTPSKKYWIRPYKEMLILGPCNQLSFLIAGK